MCQVIDQIPQMSYTVGDLDRAIALFTEELGVGPFLNVKFGHVDGDDGFNEGAMPIEDYYLEGEYVGSYGIRMGAVTWDNGIQLELIQPMENQSLFRQYLDSHGPGPQHIAVHSSLPFTETLGRMAAAGNPLASVCKVDRAEDCAFVHHKGSLGTDLEVQYRPPDYHLPEGEPPLIFPNREKVPKPLLSKLTGIAFGVREIAPVRALLEERYGIGPWVLSGPDVHGGRHAVCESLNLRLELVAPPDPEDGGDVLAAYLKKNGGNGIFYITLEAPQGLEAPLKAIERAGGKVIFQSEEAALVDFTELFGGYFRIEAAQQP